MERQNKLLKALVLLLMTLCVAGTGAKPKVTKVAVSMSKMGNLGDSKCYLDCEGWDVEISGTAENTTVKVRENASKDWETITTEDMGDVSSWADVDIFAGGGREGGTTVTMTSGKVKAIYAGCPVGREPGKIPTGDVTINVSGGTLSYVGVDCAVMLKQIDGKVSIFVSNITLYGGNMLRNMYVRNSINEFRPIDNLVIAGCTFLNDETTVYTNEMLKNISGGYFIQSVDGTEIISQVKAGQTLTIPSFVNATVEKIRFLNVETNPSYNPSSDPEDEQWRTVDAQLEGTINNLSENISVSKCNGFTHPVEKWTGEPVKVTTEHNWSETSRTSATCETAGSVTRKCKDCGKTETETTTALGHDYEDIAARPASCVADGHTGYRHCKRCNYNDYPEGFSTSKSTGHNWGEWQAVATGCDANDAVRTCKNGCGAKEYKSGNHRWSSWFSSTTNWPCNAYGTKSRNCNNCKVEEIAPNDTYNKYHNLHAVNQAKAPTCYYDGISEDYRECSWCHTAFRPLTSIEGVPREELYNENDWGEGHWLQILPAHPIIPKLGHDFSKQMTSGDFTLASSATCNEPARHYYSCSRCDVSSRNYDKSTFPVGKPNKHNYTVTNVEVDPGNPYRGKLTVGCWYHHYYSETCSMEDFTYYFDERDAGLTEIITAPTCEEGLGRYSVVVDGTSAQGDYTAKIYPLYVLDSDGEIVKDGDGNPTYQLHKWNSTGKCTKHNHQTGAYVWTTKNNPHENGIVTTDLNVVGRTFNSLGDAITDINARLDDEETLENLTIGVFEDLNLASLNSLSDCSPRLDLNGNKMTSEGKFTNENIYYLELLNGEFALVDGVDDASQEKYFSISTDKISYDRAVTGGRVVTFVLPASLPLDCIDGTVYQFTAFEDGIFKFQEVEQNEKSALYAGSTYLAKLNPTATKLIPEVVEAGENKHYIPYGMTLLPRQVGYHRYVGPNEWDIEFVATAEQIGSYSTMPIVSNAYNGTYYGYDSKDGVFVKANSGTVKPYRTAFRIPASGSSSAPARIRLQLGDDEASGIIEVDADLLTGEGSPLYDLQGRRVETMENGHIYINNGKKILK